MPNQILFLIHGMGADRDPKTGPQWADDQTDGPVALLKSLPPTVALPDLSNSITYVPIYYADIFGELVQEWKLPAVWSNPAQVLTTLGVPAGGAADNLAAILSTVQPNNNFFWTHAIDVLLYALSGQCRKAVVARVAAQMAQAINNAWQANPMPPTCSIFAHSLGTIVAQDALDSLPTWSSSSGNNPLQPTNYRFNCFFNLANITNSKLFYLAPSGTTKPYASLDKPGPVGDASSYASLFQSFHHDLDPFVYVTGVFNPSQAWQPQNLALFEDVRFNSIQPNNYDIHGWATGLHDTRHGI
jgi:hypothetical protein